LQPAFEVVSFEICNPKTETSNLHFGCDLISSPCFADTRQFQPVSSFGWLAFSDRPGKPGWISNGIASEAKPNGIVSEPKPNGIVSEAKNGSAREVAHGALGQIANSAMVTSAVGGARIAFNISGSPLLATLFIGYLRSFDRAMGRVRVWLDGALPYAITLDGRWESVGSQEETAILPLRNLLGGDRGVAECEDVPRSRTVPWCTHRVGRHTINVEALDAGKFKITRIRTCENRTLNLSAAWA
jgi:hypothetical protein